MWNHDISAAPRGKTVQTQRLVTDKNSASGQSLRVFEEFVPDLVWLATSCGQVFRSYWIEKTKFAPARWAGLGTTEQPIAWQPYIKPVHPNHQSDGGEVAAVKAQSRLADPETVEPSLSDTHHGFLEDCGSGA